MDDEDDATGVGLFTIELNERIYVVKAPTNAEARHWVEGLNLRKKNAGNTPVGLGSVQPGFLPTIDKAPLMNAPNNPALDERDNVGLKPGRGGDLWDVSGHFLCITGCGIIVCFPLLLSETEKQGLSMLQSPMTAAHWPPAPAGAVLAQHSEGLDED